MPPGARDYLLSLTWLAGRQKHIAMQIDDMVGLIQAMRDSRGDTIRSAYQPALCKRYNKSNSHR